MRKSGSCTNQQQSKIFKKKLAHIQHLLSFNKPKYVQACTISKIHLSVQVPQKEVQ